MRIVRSIAIVSLLCLLLTGCSGRKGVVSLRIIATTDVHGQIFDKDILDGQERQGSLAKLASFLKKQRKENKNVLYLDAGDILQGSIEIYQDVTAQYDRKSLAAEAQLGGVSLTIDFGIYVLTCLYIALLDYLTEIMSP